MAAIWIAYGVTVGVMALVAAVAGKARCKSFWGIFIDSRDTWSLTQFQLLLWTFIIIPVLIAVVIGRATKDPSTAWDLTVPGEVWGLLGISVGSTVLAGAIKSQKNEPPGNPLSAGDRVLAWTVPSRARFSDMFAYDEGTGSLSRLDVTKFQNFVFTVALAVTYLWNCLWLFGKAGTPSAITGLPALSGVALAILGISHAGYLTGKAIPQAGTPDVTPGKTMLAIDKFKAAPSQSGVTEAALKLNDQHDNLSTGEGEAIMTTPPAPGAGTDWCRRSWPRAQLIRAYLATLAAGRPEPGTCKRPWLTSPRICVRGPRPTNWARKRPHAYNR